jgi:Cu2+-exporting ATPase
LPSGRQRFCCAGCEAAFATIQGLGLGSYYRQRVLDPAGRPPRPEPGERWDLARYIETGADGLHTLTLAVDGVTCGACVWLIESVLAREPDLAAARVNMTTRRLRLAWRGETARAYALAALVEALGYRLVPFDPACLRAAEDRTGRVLLRALAVAGFAAANVMLLSVGTWVGLTQNMGPATRDLMHWVSALIALPAICYAGLPFFRSAAAALRHGRTNMDVPISVGVLLVSAVSLSETLRSGLHTYFDSAVTLLFFLLLGRVLDHRARGVARQTAQQLLMLRAGDVAVLQPDGTTRRRRQEAVAPGDRVLVGMGERVGADGVIERGKTTLDASLVTGESMPQPAAPGARVFAGTLNLGEAVILRATATGDTTLLAECVRLIEAAEAARGRFVVLADRVARAYAPAVHLAALLTFVLWWAVLGRPAMASVLAATAVLIVTCPCALGLAVPAVQVIATSSLFRRGILLKSGTALERLASIDTVVFDKTGTLTEPVLLAEDSADPRAVALAAAMAASSRHPLCRALVAGTGAVPLAGVVEVPGKGLVLDAQAFESGTDPSSRPPPTRGGGEERLASPSPCGRGLGEGSGRAELGTVCAGEARLGSRAFCGVADAASAAEPELWLARPGVAPTRFGFQERLRPQAAESVAALRAMGLRVVIASGDGAAPVRRVAEALGVVDWHAAQSPVAKVALIRTLRAQNHRVLMVGDGLNDGPCLAAADVSASPATAADISQTVADLVFSASLAPVPAVVRAARRARAAMRQNIALSIGYNLVMVPLAVAGYLTPWLAAIAMSSSSLLVLGNSFRAQGGKP